MKFSLKDKEILIYAAGAAGRKLCMCLEQQGFLVKGFIDKRSRELKSVDGRAVFDLDTLSTLNPQEYIIIITLKNVFQHEMVARDLFNRGFQRIIYKPESMLNNQADKDDKIINEIYECLIAFGPISQAEGIPEYTLKQPIMTDSALISGNQEECKVYLPAELLFTNQTGANIWSCTNLASTFIMTELYEAFIACGEDYQSVAKKYSGQYALLTANALGLGYGEDSIPDIISNRILVYHHMLQKLSLDPGFFIRNCTSVKRNPDGKFVLSASGKNRVCFLIAHNYRYIPVRISQEDYTYYLNQSAAVKLYQYLHSSQGRRLFAPISHPFFYNCQAFAYNYYEIWLKRVGCLLSDYVFEKHREFKFHSLRILDALKDQGNTKLFLSVLGCEVDQYPGTAEEMETYIDQLFYCKPSSKCLHSNQKYQVAMFSDSVSETEMIEILGLTEELIFVYGKRIEKLINISCKHRFIMVKKIFTSYWDQELYTGVMLKKVKEFN